MGSSKLFGAAALSLCLGLGPGVVVADAEGDLGFTQPGDPPGPQIGQDAYALRLKAYNEEVALKLVNASEVALNDFVGISPDHPRQVLVLHFWSVEHERSKRDIEVLQKMYRRYADDGLMVLGVNVDSQSSEAVHALLEDERVGFPMLRDRFGVVARRYSLRHLPTVYVIDADGRVTSVREGYTEDISDVLEFEVKELLKR